MELKPKVDITQLWLDELNPRLPEELRHATQSAILSYLFTNADLDELARSMVDNGFFVHEPLIVTARPTPSGSYDVIEGNRRLAALHILLQLPVAVESELSFPFLEEEGVAVENLESLRTIPCYVIADRDDVHRFLGFRHIGGIKTWSAEAKARYLLREVERLAGEVDESAYRSIFTLVGRRVGSNAQGVRNPYIAIKILLYGRDEFRYRYDMGSTPTVRCVDSPDELT